MKKRDSHNLEFISATVASLHGIFNAQVLQGYFERFWLYVGAALVVCFFVILYGKRPSFPAGIVGAALGLAYVFLRFLHSLGIQLPGKGLDVFLPSTYTMAFAYVAATGALACAVIWLLRYCSQRNRY